MDFTNTMIKLCINALPKQAELFRVDRETIRSLIYKQCPPQRYVYKDRTNLLVNLDFIRRFGETSFVPTLAYEKETFDCDDSANVMRAIINMLRQGHAFGICVVDRKPNESGGAHQLNIFVGEDEVVYLFEPQSGVFFLPPKEWQIIAIEI